MDVDIQVNDYMNYIKLERQLSKNTYDGYYRDLKDFFLYTNKDYKDLIEILSNINFNIGKYGIKGDNDLKIKKWEEVINESNFINLI